MMLEEQQFGEADYFYSVKFLKQKQARLAKEDQQRHQIYDNFHSAIFKMEIRKDSTLSAIRDMLAEALEDEGSTLDFDNVCFINRGPKKISNIRDSNIYNQAILKNSSLGEIYKGYDPLDPVIIEIIPKRISVQLDFIIEGQGDPQVERIEKAVKIYGRIDDLFLNLGIYKPLGTGCIYEYTTYTNVYGEEENIGAVMQDKVMIQDLEAVNDKDELWKVVFLRELHVPFYNLDANFYQPIRLKIIFREGTLDEYWDNVLGGWNKSQKLFLDELAPNWESTVCKFKNKWDIAFRGITTHRMPGLLKVMQPNQETFKNFGKKTIWENIFNGVVTNLNEHTAKGSRGRRIYGINEESDD